MHTSDYKIYVNACMVAIATVEIFREDRIV